MIDAYSGATISSTAVFNAVDAALLQFAVANGAAYEAPVELTPEEQFAQAQSLALPEGDTFEKLDVELIPEHRILHLKYTKLRTVQVL